MLELNTGVDPVAESIQVGAEPLTLDLLGGRLLRLRAQDVSFQVAGLAMSGGDLSFELFKDANGDDHAGLRRGYEYLGF